MMFLVQAAALALLTGSLTAAAQTAQSPAQPPAGISTRMTLNGRIYVDANGMTLYHRIGNLEFGRAPCPDQPDTRLNIAIINYNQVAEFPMTVPDAKSRRSCSEKYPPLLAAPNARPFGNWTLHPRKNGQKQWGYRGSPLHTSIKDKLPGEINGAESEVAIVAGASTNSWSVVLAPLAMPSGVATRLTTHGRALTSHLGQTLYHGESANQKSTEAWRPFLAPAAANGTGYADWSIVSLPDGSRQWVYKGKPLYTYSEDAGDEAPKGPFVESFGNTDGKSIAGWRIVLLHPGPAYPREVRLDAGQALAGARIYTDTKGMTLYAMYCVEGTTDRLACDDVGDSPRYWLSFCGGEERCQKMWRPLPAPADAKPIDGIWSVAVINPSHPWRPVQGEEGVRVWTYRGRPVFTYAEDRVPGDYRGITSSRHSMMGAYSIVALSVR